MNDMFITALNTQKSTTNWMDVIADNMTNVYTPGFREKEVTFKTFLGGAISDDYAKKTSQGKSTPGTANENLFLEGKGFFLTKRADGKSIYTRLGEFTFDKEGVYRDKSGNTVQGYILNDKGEVMQGTKSISADLYQETALKGGSIDVPTTNIKMWIDPNNGKYLGKYDDYEIKGDGTIYGKADGGKKVVPLYRITTRNFHNAAALYEIKDGQFIETAESGKPVLGNGEIRSGLLELSNSDFKANISYFQMAKLQLDISNKLVSTNKELLQNAIQLVGS
ncbi:MAG: flagellar hook-basal body complex protein [Clostridiaceae bacterium]|jgi:flagellar hook protein FlgE|nr:flagellar hook-basal body complex protein [Clostridiaceae bacterium]